jgi:anti-sigma factor RsiW
MISPDLHTLTGAYVVDALDADEREQFEAHLLACPACRQEVAELTATTDRLAVAATEAPPAGLRDRVLAEVAGTPQLPPVVGDRRAEPPTRPPWYRQPLSWAAAVLLVMAGGLVAVAVTQAQRAERAEERADRIAAIATDPGRVERTGETAAGGSGTVVAAGGSAIFRAAGLRERPEDRTYQLWVISGDGATSAGVLGRDGRLEAIVDGVQTGDALGLTVEPEGGSPQPTGDLVLRLDLAS